VFASRSAKAIPFQDDLRVDLGLWPRLVLRQTPMRTFHDAMPMAKEERIAA
jgi:hypothetical protein